MTISFEEDFIMKLLRKGLLVLIAAALLLAFAACSEGGSDPDTTVYIDGRRHPLYNGMG